MKFIYNPRLTVVIVLVAAVLASGCKKYLEVPLPIDQLSIETVYKSRNGIDAVVTGMYSAFAEGAIKGNYYKFTSFISDEGEINPLPGSDVGALLAANIAATNQQLASWLWFYRGIYRANDLITNLPAVPTTILPEADRKSYIAAAKYVRAAEHFTLVTTWGDVPLILTTSAEENINMPRTPEAEVMAAIVKDLQEAVADLPATVNTTNVGALRIHNKFQAQALLARVYLYLGRWAEAEAAATDVISSGQYQLVTGVNNVFRRGSREIITAHGATSTGSLFENRTVYGWLMQPISVGQATTNYPAMSPTLLAAFETGDQRRVAGNWTSSLFGRVFPNKYLHSILAPAATIAANPQDFIYQRLAEVYLIRAEARAQQGKVTGPNSAASDINAVRTRAGLPDATATTQTDMLTAIEKERLTELFFEGFRWYDLKRTNRMDQVFANTPWKAANYKPYMKLMPIPIAELNANPRIQQNTGY